MSSLFHGQYSDEPKFTFSNHIKYLCNQQLIYLFYLLKSWWWMGGLMDTLSLLLYFNIFKVIKVLNVCVKCRMLYCGYLQLC